MNPIAALTEKPWLNPGLSAAEAARPDEAAGPWDKGVGLSVFLFVVTMLFGLVTSAYLMRMGVHASAAAHAPNDWYPLGEPPLLWFNTALLAISSLAFHGALLAARRGDAPLLRWGMVAGGLTGIGFLAGQYLLWRHYDSSGYALASTIAICTPVSADPLSATLPITRSGNPAIAFFYLISGLHALHILGGLAAWGVAARRLFGGAAPASAARAVQLCARYWHFMLLVWLAMVVLFVTT